MAMKVGDAQSEYKQSREQYKQATADFRSIRQSMKGNAADADSIVDSAKDLLRAVIDVARAHLNLLAARVEASPVLSDSEKAELLDDINDYLAWYDDKYAEIDDIEDVIGIRDAWREIRDKWHDDVLVTMAQTAAQILNSKVDDMIERAEDASMRMDEFIVRAEERGLDTERLEELRDEYDDSIASAKEKNEEARDKFDEIPTSGTPLGTYHEGRQILSEAREDFREAFQTLRQFIQEFRSLVSTHVRGTGTLYAQGDGEAMVKGDGYIEIKAAKGKLTIVDPGKDADITVTGEGTKKETGDRTVYEGFDGYARVSGPNIHVRIEGTDIDLEASGTGVAMLKGSGTYWTESMGQDDAKQWPVQGGRLTLKKA